MSENSAVLSGSNQARSTLEMLYARILDTGECESAKRIWDACEFLAKNKSTKITASAVGKYCSEKFGGPRAQSITNRQSSLAELVRCWDSFHQWESGRRRSSANVKSSTVVIDDPTTAAYVAVMESQIQELRISNQRLNKAFREMKPLQIGVEVKESASNGTVTAAGGDITDLESDAIRRFLSADHLAKFDLHIDDRGRIKDGTRVLVERPVVAVLSRLATHR